MDASQLPKMQSKELNGDGRPINLPGVYVHKDTKQRYITPDGDEGVVHADALMSPVWKDAWERVGDVPSRLEILEMQKAQEVKDATEAAIKEGKESADLKEATKQAIEEAKKEVAVA